MLEKKINTSPVKEAPAMSQELHMQRERDRVMVRGKFMFHEVPGGNMGFVFRKYKGDPLEKYDMNDGEIYTIPLGVAKHLNSNCSYPSYSYKNDDQGRPVMSMSERVRRCSFQSLEFFDTSASVKESALPSL